MDKARLQAMLRIVNGAVLLVPVTPGRFGPAAAWGVVLSVLLTKPVTIGALFRVLGLAAKDPARGFAPGLTIATVCAVSVLVLGTRLEGVAPALLWSSTSRQAPRSGRSSWPS
jgi:hypothetical protein